MPRYEYTDDKSNKFWEIEMSGTEVTTRWGKIGTDGQEKTKDFGSEEKAQKEYDKLVEEKTKKGYELVGGGSNGNGKPAKKAAEKKEPAPKKAPAPKKKPAASNGDTTIGEEWQRYEFIEGGSKKFWEVKVDGDQYFTRYGRIGSEGKITVKQADSEDDARVEAEKLLASKLKKGYERAEA